jgi:predicted ATP-binding protein involved in virulence
MPIFVNYGVSRAVTDIPLRIIRNRHEFDQKSAFEKSIESKIDFRLFFEWFRNQEDYENQIRAHENSAYKDVALSAVREVTLGLFDSSTNLRITRNPLAMKIDKDGKALSINQLSEGEKCLIALLGDLARRLTLANPTSKVPLEGGGVVLIDEIELHMHPRWQRKIIPFLIERFPNVQFIISTHSPQVLGELDSGINILSMKRESDNLEIQKINSMNGWDANSILEDYMETDSLSVYAKKLIQDIYVSIENIKDRDDIEAAKTKIGELKQLTDSVHVDVVKAEILLRRKIKV